MSPNRISTQKNKASPYKYKYEKGVFALQSSTKINIHKLSPTICSRDGKNSVTMQNIMELMNNVQKLCTRVGMLEAMCSVNEYKSSTIGLKGKSMMPVQDSMNTIKQCLKNEHNMPIVKKKITEQYEIQDSLSFLTFRKKILKLPFILLNRFQSSDHHGKCKLCNILVDWNCKNIVAHLFNCKSKYELTGINKTVFNTFICYLCKYSIDDIKGHEAHIISYDHLIMCHDTTNLYSYFCIVCNTYMYGHKNDIANHQKLIHKQDSTELTELSLIMANIFIEMNINQNSVVTNNLSTNTSNFCSVCNVKFKTVIDYEMHTITSEHIILKFLTPRNQKQCLKNDHNLPIVNKIKTIEQFVIQDIPSFSTLKKIKLPESVVNDSQNNHMAAETSNAVINVCDVITSTPNNSLTTISTVAHKPNVDKNKSISLIHLVMPNDGVNLNDSVFPNANDTSEEIDIKCSLVSRPLTNVTNPGRKEVLLEDIIFGNYVIERLKQIENPTVKHYIKLQIDNIFYSKLKKYLMEYNK